jgi:cytochrome c-type biogenesis protein CcmH
MRTGLMRVGLVLAALLIAAPATAVEPGEILKDPVLEGRARDISRELRCLVCQNQSIDDSNADLARDLRVLVRERLTAGDSNPQVFDYVVARYGDFVLLSPPLKSSTLILWGAPGILLIFGAIGLVFWYRRRGAIDPTDALTEDEQQRLAVLLKPEDGQ